MGARFSQGDSMRTTRMLTQSSPVKTERGSGRGKAGGMPGYIKTAQDKSSAGLASTKPVGPRFNEGETTATTNKTTQMRAQGAYIGQKGGKTSANERFNTGKLRGSSDKSYRATSTGPAGTIRRMGEPKAPRSMKASEKEGPQRGRSGERGAVAAGGVKGANRLPAGGIKAGARGTMESLRGRAKMGSGKRTMY